MSAHATSPVGREGMRALLHPRRLAYVGASDKNLFSRRAFAQQQRFAHSSGEVTLVNPRSPEVHGRRTVPTCSDVPGGIDCAYLLTPQHATIEALRDAAAAGARAAVVLSQGWAEAGAEGVEQQAALVSEAQHLGVTLLGPNHLGFANLHDGVAATGLGLDLPVEPGGFALVSQSGAVGSSLVGYADRQDVRFSFVVTTGNEAMVAIADVVDHLVADPNTASIGIFAETIRKPDLFLAAVDRAADAGKPVFILKVGASELAARTAAAHTGALVGDDRVIDAVLRQHGVVRVDSLEDLIVSGHLAATVGRLRAPGVGILSVSGGACDLVADRGESVGLSIPSLGDATTERLGELLPSYAHPQNPLDVTGGALADPEVWRNGIAVMAQEARIGLFGIVTSLPREGEPQRAETFHAVGGALARAGLPGVVFPQVEQAPSDVVRQVRRESGVDAVLPGLERFVVAAAHLGRWSEWLGTRRPSGAGRSGGPVELAPGPLSEHDARGLLAAAGVPLAPAVLTATPEEAVAAAASYGCPVALKVCSAQVQHKTELGGVALDVSGEGAVREAWHRVTAGALAAGHQVDGVLVGPMRSGGDELVVGVVRDPDWGPVLAVGLGGQLVELLDDVSLRVLPVDADEVHRMLNDLAGARLLHGYRGRPRAHLDAVVRTIVKVAGLFSRLPDDVSALEVNPMRVHGDEVEALDVLITRR